MRTVILGAGGCFGRNLAQYLSNFGHTVMGIGRSQVKELPYSLGFDYDYRVFHLIDQFDEAWLDISAFKPDFIINFAAQAGLVPQSWEYPEEFYETNTLLPVRISKTLDCRYIHIGSSEVYGSNITPVPEEAPIRCSSPYAVSKAAADLHLMSLKDERITILRPSNCYCPGQALYRLIPRAVYSCVSETKMPLQGDTQKSYLHAEDLSAAVELLIRRPQPGVFNVGSVNPVSIQKVVSMVADCFGKNLEDIAEVKEGRKNEDSCFWISSEKIMRLGWKPVVTLTEGLEEMSRWGKKYAAQIMSMSLTYEFRK